MTPSAPPGLVLSADPDLPPALVVRAIETDDIQNLSPFPVQGAPFGNSGADLLAVAARAAAGSGRRIGFDEDVTLAAKLLALQAAMPWATLVSGAGLIMKLRYIKTADEIAQMRRAAEVSDRAMLAAVEAIRAGQTEAAAAAAAEATWRAEGLGPAYEVLIGSGKRSAALRRFPSLVVPGTDDLVRFDFAARLSPAAGFGYNNDMTRTFTPGKPGNEHAEMLKAGLAVFEATLAGLKPGRTIAESAADGLREVKGTRYERITNMAGHGVGADVHEPPSFAAGSDFVMQAGHCFAIEPMVCIPGEKGVCFENTVVITETGHESLNRLGLRLWGR
ncbi:MAG: M24 family metallopeptidase [Armatimonadota bacterium]